jgi:ABC-type sugar transport system permease subunit
MLALTDGANKTTSFVLNVYKEAFKNERVGYSTAQAIILLLIIMGISIVQLSIMKKKELQY